MVSIYVLKHPVTGVIFYVGLTNQKDIAIRLRQHCCRAYNHTGGSFHKDRYIRRLKVEGLIPKIQVIALAKKEEAPYVERYWIRCYRKLGVNLTNLTDGGEVVDKIFSIMGGQATRGVKLKTRKCSSIYVGVRWHQTRHAWQAYTTVGKRQYHLGLYSTELEAAAAYDKAVLFMYNQKSYLRTNLTEDYTQESIDKIGVERRLPKLTKISGPIPSISL